VDLPYQRGGGINDEQPVAQEVYSLPRCTAIFYPPRLSDGLTIRVTHNKWEDGTVFWFPAASVVSG